MKRILLFIAVFLFTACASYTQTNKIPNDKKYYLPDTNQNNSMNKTTFNSREIQQFSDALEEFFKKNREEYKKDEEENINIYQIGIEKGYFK